MSRKTSIAAIAAFITVAAFATDATFNNPDTRQPYWLTLGNWVDTHTGEALAALPTNATDNVTFSTPGSLVYAQRIGIGSGQATSEHFNFTVNSVTGGIRHVICNMFTWYEGTNTKHPTLTVLNPNGFLGWWFSGDAHANFCFPASASFTPEITAISANARPEVSVPDAGTSAHLGALYNGGAMTKLGGGELVLDGAGGANTRIYVAEGGVTLSGHGPDGTLEALLDGAAMHFDASDGSTLLKNYSQADGRTYVTNWMDVRKNGIVANKPNVIYSNAGRTILMNSPFIAAGAADSGLDMIDFGSATTDAESGAAFGPTNCLMGFEQLTNVREVFYAAKYHARPGFNPVLGDNAAATLQPASTLLGGSANIGARTGAIFANGTKVVANEFWPESGHGLTNLWVMSFGSPSNMVFSRIASDQDIVGRVGGLMVGEILLYTNALSNAERIRINSYLYGKWKTGNAIDVDAGQVFMQGAAATVGVAEGDTARVMDLVAPNSKVVKTGGGTLEIDALYPADAKLDVRAGAVKIASVLAAPSTTAPAANPAVWLDASDGTSYTTTEIEGYDTPFVTSWTDKRGGPGAVTAAGSTLDAPRKPTIAAGASPTGLDVMDLKTTGHSFFKFSWFNDKTPRFRAGFAVVRQLSGDRTYVPVFGSKDMTFMREGSVGGSHGRFVSEGYSHPVLGAAAWTLDGVPQDPEVYNATLKETSNFHVIAFSAREKVLVDGIAVARNNNEYSGGMQVGEFILYDRELSEKERRDTEAYLMAKWNGATHPCTATPSPAMDFDPSVDQVIDTDGSAAIASVSGGTGALVKRGTGAATIATPVTNEVSSISVENGDLTISAGNPAIDDDALLFHFDAMDEESLVYADDGNGGTYLAEWLDVRRNGIKAITAVPGGDYASQFVKKTPTVSELTVRTGVTRPLLNFGGVAGGSSAAMYMNQSFSNVREGHTIHKDIGKNSMFFSWSQLNPTSGGVSYNDYFRNSTGTFYGDSACAALKSADAHWAANGERSSDPRNELIPTDASLISIVATGNTHVNTIQYDRTVAGGAYVGEQMAFSRPLSEVQRKYLQDYMMWKWFEEGAKPVWTNAAYSAVSAAAGTTLAFADSPDIAVESLGGAGDISAGRIFGVSSLTVPAESVANGEHLVVSGELAFADSVAVTIVGSCGVLAPGDYPLVEADSLENAELAGWTYNLDSLSSRRRYAIVRVGNTIVLRVTSLGAVMIIR